MPWLLKGFCRRVVRICVFLKINFTKNETEAQGKKSNLAIQKGTSLMTSTEIQDLSITTITRISACLYLGQSK